MTYSLWKSVFIISHAKNIRQSSQQLFSEIVNGIPLENLPSCNLYRVKGGGEIIGSELKLNSWLLIQNHPYEGFMYLKANLEFGKRTVSKRRQLTMSCSIFVASFFHRFLKMLEFSLETASGTMPNFSAYFGSSLCSFETICQSVALK